MKVAKKEAAPTASPPEEPGTSQTPNEKTTKSPNQFPGWREVIHPSRLVTAAGQIPLMSQNSKQRPQSKSFGERMAGPQRAEEQVQNLRSEPTSPTGALET